MALALSHAKNYVVSTNCYNIKYVSCSCGWEDSVASKSPEGREGMGMKGPAGDIRLFLHSSLLCINEQFMTLKLAITLNPAGDDSRYIVMAELR
jgi:hypothetical protein